MSAVLKANPNMGTDPMIIQEQWMLVTMTAGVGVMGKMHGIYTFGSHMKLAWTVLVGYIVSVTVWYLQFNVLHIG